MQHEHNGNSEQFEQSHYIRIHVHAFDSKGPTGALHARRSRLRLFISLFRRRDRRGVGRALRSTSTPSSGRRGRRVIGTVQSGLPPQLHTHSLPPRCVHSSLLLRPHTPHHTTPQHSTAQHSTTQHSTPHHTTQHNSTAQHNTAQHSTAQHTPHRITNNTTPHRTRATPCHSGKYNDTKNQFNDLPSQARGAPHYATTHIRMRMRMQGYSRAMRP